MKIRFAVMGPGRISSKFCEAVRLTDCAEVYAVASKSLDRAKALAERFGIAEYFGSYDEMLQNDDIDAVYISTTHNFHYDNIKQCLQSGKHVLCEKSMCVNRSDAEELFAFAKEKGLLLVEGMWIRHLGTLNKAKALIAEGAVGRIILADAVAGFKAQVEPSHRLINPALGGGVAFDISVYAIEAVTYLLGGDIKSVSGKAVRNSDGTDIVNSIILDYGDYTANILTTLAASPPNSLLVAGSDGYIVIPSFIGGRELTLCRYGEEPQSFSFPYENGFQFEIIDFVDCIRRGRTESAIMPVKDTIQCAGIFDVVLNSR
jgi:predicted dehydrogenase